MKPITILSYFCFKQNSIVFSVCLWLRTVGSFYQCSVGYLILGFKTSLIVFSTPYFVLYDMYAVT